MPRCPNCNYLLVLLEHRQKYKCAKCGKLFPQREIELREFHKSNKEERSKSRKRYKKESTQNYHAEKIIPKIIEELKNPKPRKSDAEKKREYRKSLSEQEKKEQNEKRNERRHKNVDGTRLNSRIWYWRNRQKALAVEMMENKVYRGYRVEKRVSLPTTALSYQLF